MVGLKVAVGLLVALVVAQLRPVISGEPAALRDMEPVSMILLLLLLMVLPVIAGAMAAVLLNHAFRPYPHLWVLGLAVGLIYGVIEMRADPDMEAIFGQAVVQLAMIPLMGVLAAVLTGRMLAAIATGSGEK